MDLGKILNDVIYMTLFDKSFNDCLDYLGATGQDDILYELNDYAVKAIGQAYEASDKLVQQVPYGADVAMYILVVEGATKRVRKYWESQAKAAGLVLLSGDPRLTKNTEAMFNRDEIERQFSKRRPRLTDGK